MRLLINVKEVFYANILMMKKHQVKIKQTLIIEIGLSVLSHPIQKMIPMRIWISSVTSDQ